LEEPKDLGQHLVLLRGRVVFASDDDFLSGVIVYNVLDLVIRVSIPSSDAVHKLDFVGTNMLWHNFVAKSVERGVYITQIIVETLVPLVSISDVF
jgi:hypothetical protein